MFVLTVRGMLFMHEKDYEELALELAETAVGVEGLAVHNLGDIQVFLEEDTLDSNAGRGILVVFGYDKTVHSNEKVRTVVLKELRDAVRTRLSRWFSVPRVHFAAHGLEFLDENP